MGEILDKVQTLSRLFLPNKLGYTDRILNVFT
jgi:hypothetical protein